MKALAIAALPCSLIPFVGLILGAIGLGAGLFHRRRSAVIMSSIALPIALLITIAAAAAPTPATSASPQAPPPAQAAPATGLPTLPPHTIALQSVRDHAYAVLTASIAHYRAVFAQGQAIIDNTQYASGMDGLTAMDDPTSAAARFRDYRRNPDPERDLSYQDAFKAADSRFTAADEPQAISDWRDDIGAAQADISQWVSVATDYQISTTSQAGLDAAAAKVNQDLAKADADARAVQQG